MTFQPIAASGGQTDRVRGASTTVKPNPGHQAMICAAASIAADGSVAVTGSYDRTARIWDLTTGRPGHVLKGHSDVVHAVACTVVGQRRLAVTASGDRTARI